MNPRALGVARDPTLGGRLAVLLGADGRVVETRTPLDLDEALRAFRGEGRTIVGLCGGDGTNLATLTAAARVWGPAPWPRFAILRGGTVNTVANNLGLRGRPEDVLLRVVAAARGGTLRSVARDTVRVDHGEGGRVGFIFGAGMGARFFDAYYGGPMTGLPWAGLLAARIVGSALAGGSFAARVFEPAEARLVADGDPALADRFTLVVASTVRDMGLGLRVAWRAGAETGRFHLVASSLPASRLARQVARVLRGRPLRGEPHLDRLARRVEIRFAREETYVLDGDLFRAREVTIEAGPRVDLVLA